MSLALGKPGIAVATSKVSTKKPSLIALIVLSELTLSLVLPELSVAVWPPKLIIAALIFCYAVSASKAAAEMNLAFLNKRVIGYSFTTT